MDAILSGLLNVIARRPDLMEKLIEGLFQVIVQKLEEATAKG